VSTSSSSGTTVYSVAITSGAVTQLWPVASRKAFWIGVSEQGHEVAVGEGQITQTSWFEPNPDGFGFRVRGEPQVLSNCAIVYRELASGTVRGETVATDEVCRGQRGQGTIAPAPPVSSGGR
ncbi:MAG: hypothetical protein ACREMC_03660, partial [Gemmatimonadales bacterium]